MLNLLNKYYERYRRPSREENAEELQQELQLKYGLLSSLETINTEIETIENTYKQKLKVIDEQITKNEYRIKAYQAQRNKEQEINEVNAEITALNNSKTELKNEQNKILKPLLDKKQKIKNNITTTEITIKNLQY